jgi:uncharacterized integral membrane protein
VADDNAPTPGTTGSGTAERKERARLIGALLLVVIIAALAFDNRQKVRIGYVIGDSEVRLVYLLLVTAALGAGAGRLARWRRSR